MKRFVDGAGRRVLLPEAGAREGSAGVAADRDLHLPQRPDGDRAGRQRRGAPGLGGQPRGDRLQPAPGPASRPRLPGRAAGRPRPARRACAGTPSARWRSASRTSSRSTGSAASRRPRAPAASTSTSGSSRAGTTTRSAGPRWRWRGRWSAASPKNATSKWWKEERHGVFVDYNQNARDRTIASGYSVRPVPDARVCCPLDWDEVPDVEPAELRLDTVPARVKKRGDPSADIDEHAGSLDAAARAGPARRGGGARRRPLASPLPQAARRAEAGAAEPGEEEKPTARKKPALQDRGAARSGVMPVADADGPATWKSRRADARLSSAAGAGSRCDSPRRRWYARRPEPVVAPSHASMLERVARSSLRCRVLRGRVLRSPVALEVECFEVECSDHEGCRVARATASRASPGVAATGLRYPTWPGASPAAASRGGGDGGRRDHGCWVPPFAALPPLPGLPSLAGVLIPTLAAGRPRPAVLRPSPAGADGLDDGDDGAATELPDVRRSARGSSSRSAPSAPPR